MKNKLLSFGRWCLAMAFLAAISPPMTAQSLTNGFEQRTNSYCIPEGTNTSRFINNFSTTNGITNITNEGSGFSPGGYGDFYDTHSVGQEPGEDISFSVDIQGGTAGFRAWVDWNQDGVFDTTEEVAWQSSGYASSHSGTITVPADALEGETRMRIVSHWLSSTGDVNPCATGFTYGEFEDYKFVVEGGSAPVVYCIPEGTNASRFIDNFSTTGGATNITNNGSGFSTGGYGDFYDTHSVGQEPGEEISFSVDIQGGIAGFRVWVDWNQDGVFDTTEEVAWQSSGYGNSHSGTITVPADALEGETRMRIVSHWLSTTGDVNPCATGFTYGEFEDYKFIVGEGTSTGESCDLTYAGSLEDGIGNLRTLRFADDFELPAETSMTIDQVTMRIFADISDADVYFYENNNGKPGTLIESFTEITPTSKTFVMEQFGFNVYEVVIDLPSSVTVDGGATGALYWLGLQVYEGDEGATNYWEVADLNRNAIAHYSNDGGVTWVASSSGDDLAFKLSGMCEGDITQPDPFPAPYCSVAGNSSVEAISRVIFADIDNASDPNGNIPHEDFTHIVAHVDAGETYTITVEGNTSGNFTNYFTAWIDWNQDGVFDETTERYDIGSIANSTGSDGKQASVDIPVPADALDGETRMRVMKRFSAFPNNSCTSGSTFGQTEDYTVDVSGGGTIDPEDCAFGISSDAELSNAYNITISNNFHTADDFIVEADVTFTLEQIFINTNQQEVPNTAVIYIHEDNNGNPGTILHTINTSPDDSEVVGSAFGDPVYLLTFDLDTPLEFTEGTYWINPKMSTASGEVVWLAVTEDESYGAIARRSVDGGVTWEIDSDGANAIISVAGSCDSGGDPDPTGECDITTLYDGGNNGSAGGIVYFDLTVADSDIDLTAFDLNTDNTGAGFTVDVYTIEGTYVGNETNQSAWTLAAQGSGTSAGQGSPSHAELDDIISLSANTSYGIALVLSSQHSHHYTNGNGTNEHYENDHLSLDLGAANNTPWGASPFSPRVFNGGIYYEVEGGCGGDPIPSDCPVSYEGGLNDGLGDLSGSIILAADFPVDADEQIDVENVLVHILNDLTSIEISFYEDAGGQPGTEVFPPATVVPVSQVLLAYTANGTPVYEYELDMTSHNISLSGGASGAKYWMAITTNGTANYWGYATQIHNGTNFFASMDGYATWEDVAGYGFVEDGAFSINCEPSDPTEPQCLFNIAISVEPITRVILGDIDNTSSPVVNGSPALEDFTHIEGNLSQGATYEIALEGNTDGPFTNYFTAWIDWNQDGEWTADEMYEIGSINNSTGTDGKQAVGSITVPADAPLGATTMRVIKNFNSSPTDPCGTYNYGQAEDYTIIVDDEIGIDNVDKTAFSFYPNPAKDVLNITVERDIQSVTVFNVLGQQVLSTTDVAGGKVDVSALTTGAYMFRVTFENGGTETFKVLKE